MGDRCSRCMCDGSEFCDNQIGDDEWFCSYCGKRRAECPDCGSRYARSDRECSSCETPRKAACEECDSVIDATASICPECDAPNAEKRSHGERRKKQGLALGVATPVVAYVLFNGLFSGILSVLTWFFWIPTASIGIILGYLVHRNGRKHISKALDDYPSSLKHGKTIHRTQAFVDHREEVKAERERKERERERKERERKRKERERKRKEKEERKTLSDRCPRCSKTWKAWEAKDGDGYELEGFHIQESGHDEYVIADCYGCGLACTVDIEDGEILGRRIIDMNCPICGYDWTVWKDDDENGVLDDDYRLDGISTTRQDVDVTDGRVEVQCYDCNKTRRITVE